MTEFVKDIVIYILSGVIAIISYFGKSLHNDFKSMQKDIETLNRELAKVETESKRYWSEHKMQMENNQNLLMERINHTNENNKAAVAMIKEMFEAIDRRLDKLEK
jgi:septal ring factor EnvC (AmiA/AmiB activator)